MQNTKSLSKDQVIVNIHGKAYDLTEFAPKHPGGATILNVVNGQTDATALFETYHGFLDINSIEKQMKQYEIGPATLESPGYDFTNYRKFAALVKEQIPEYKANNLWYIKSSILFLTFFLCFFYPAFYEVTVLQKIIMASIAGTLFISLGFVFMHDGCHYAIDHGYQKNETYSRIWHCIALWNHFIWARHHTYAHHSHTGDQKLDPDLRHSRPFFRKFKADPKIIKYTGKIQHIIAPMLYLIFPGMYILQCVSYYVGAFKGYLWSFTLKYHEIKKDITKLEIFIYAASAYALWNHGLLYTFFYVSAINAGYFICIIPDHDSFETAIENHSDTKDWLHKQIMNSGNFVTNNMVFTHLFGAINYQIEHHVFPAMSHMHYPKVKPIIQKYIKENNLQYVDQPSIYAAYSSFIKTMKYMNDA